MSSANDAKPERNRQHVYAIIRIDDFLGPDIALDRKVTVKKVVRNEAEATAEVERLNGLQREPGVFYFHQLTRLEEEQTIGDSVRDREAVECEVTQ